MPFSVLLGAFDAVKPATIGLSNDGLIVSANRAAEVIFGHAAGALVGQSIELVMPEPLGSAHADFWKNFWSNPASGPIGGAGETVIGIRKNGVPVPLEVTLNVVVISDARYVVASIGDISERMHLEWQPSAAREHLAFERLIADIATRFANIKAAAADETIVTSLGQIVEALRLDRAILWRYRNGEANAVPTHYWMAPGHDSPPQPSRMASLPWVFSKLTAGEPCWFTRLDEIPDPVDRETFRKEGPKSCAVLPLPRYEDDVLRALAFSSMTEEQKWTPELIERMRLVVSIVGQALANMDNRNALDHALDDLHRLRRHPADDNAEPRRELKTHQTSSLIVSDSAAVKQAFMQAEQVAATPSTVLLLGETGSGKDVFAQAIHDLSPRHHRPMVRVSCGAIPSALIESELFGRERGAYTGALSRQIGRFEAANQSTLFLDEIGELQPEVQVKLLRVIQERVIERLGSTQPIKVDVRIIAATHRNLEKAVSDGTFREDLFYRLNVFPITVPPLRERAEDIPGLVWAFVDEFSRSFGRTIESVSKESMKELQRYAWPGNVRELRNIVERAVIVSTGTHLVVPVPGPPGLTPPRAALTLEALEVGHIRSVLESTNWRVRGPGGAAARLGLKPTTLESRMAKLGIARKASK